MRSFPVIAFLTMFVLFPALLEAADSSAESQVEFSLYNEQYNELVANYDLESFVALYSDSPLWIAPDKGPVAGLDVPRNTFQFIIENEGRLTHTFDHLFVSDDGSQAVMIGQYDALIESVGAESVGTYLFVLAREAEQWKIVVDMFNEH